MDGTFRGGSLVVKFSFPVGITLFDELESKQGLSLSTASLVEILIAARMR